MGLRSCFEKIRKRVEHARFLFGSTGRAMPFEKQPDGTKDLSDRFESGFYADES